MSRDIDVLVIGGGAAGTAAALQLGRVRRSVVVVDAGEPRNAPAAQMHGYLGHDGAAPAEFIARAHAEAAECGVVIVHDRVARVHDATDRLVCTTAGGSTYRARRIVLATGLTDLLPDIPGVRELWGDRVIHCPWCHGWEARDRRIAVIDTSGMGAHQALVFAQLSDRVTLIRNLEPGLTVDDSERLRFGGVDVEPRGARAVRALDDHLAIDIEGGTLDVDVAVVGPRFEPNVSVVEHLVDVVGHVSGMGRHVAVDDAGTTSHPSIFAVGNVADPMQQVLHGAANGSLVATMLNAGLIDHDIERARHSAEDQDEWDARYGEHDGSMWSGSPNGSLVAAIAELVPGRALDVGCGEGADAIWLARNGWQVTATDISATAIDRARVAATTAGVDVAFDAVDVVIDPPPTGGFDLVAISYPALKRTTGLAAVPSIIDAVAPGGHLLVVGHVLDDDAIAHAAEHGFDPDDYVSPDDILGALNDVDAGFSIEVDATCERPDAPPDARHSHDRILLARRRFA